MRHDCRQHDVILRCTTDSDVYRFYDRSQLSLAGAGLIDSSETSLSGGIADGGLAGFCFTAHRLTLTLRCRGTIRLTGPRDVRERTPSLPLLFLFRAEKSFTSRDAFFTRYRALFFFGFPRGHIRRYHFYREVRLYASRIKSSIGIHPAKLFIRTPASRAQALFTQKKQRRGCFESGESRRPGKNRFPSPSSPPLPFPRTYGYGIRSDRAA